MHPGSLRQSIDLAVATIRDTDLARYDDPSPCADRDLAAATGPAVDVADDLGAVVLEGVLAMAPSGRDGGWFGAEVMVPADASAFECALAASGRDPRWTP